MAEIIQDLKLQSDPSTIVRPNIVADNIPDGCITGNKVVNDSISGGKIVPGSITKNRMGLGSVGTDELEASAVTTSKIADSAVTSLKIADNAIITGKIASGAVTDDKIANATIKRGKLSVHEMLFDDFIDELGDDFSDLVAQFKHIIDTCLLFQLVVETGNGTYANAGQIEYDDVTETLSVLFSDGIRSRYNTLSWSGNWLEITAGNLASVKASIAADMTLRYLRA